MIMELENKSLVKDHTSRGTELQRRNHSHGISEMIDEQDKNNLTGSSANWIYEGM